MLGQTITGAQILNVGGQLRENRSRLDNLFQFMRQSPAFARDYGRQVAAAQQKHGEAVAKYQGFLALIGLPRAAGLEGLGIALGPIIIGAAAVIQWLAVVALVAVALKLTSELIGIARTYVEMRAVETKSKAELMRASQEAAARGDYDTARLLAAQAASAGTPGVLETFGKSLPWIAGIVAVAVVGPAVIDAID